MEPSIQWTMMLGGTALMFGSIAVEYSQLVRALGSGILAAAGIIFCNMN